MQCFQQKLRCAFWKNIKNDKEINEQQGMVGYLGPKQQITELRSSYPSLPGRSEHGTQIGGEKKPCKAVSDFLRTMTLTISDLMGLKETLLSKQKLAAKELIGNKMLPCFAPSLVSWHAPNEPNWSDFRGLFVMTKTIDLARFASFYPRHGEPPLHRAYNSKCSFMEQFKLSHLVL